MLKCPGQDQRNWKPEDIFEIKCPHCHKNIEFFKDEPRLKCKNCKKEVRNPRIDLGCAQWCQFAEQCLGSAAEEGRMGAICEALIREMKTVFGKDQKRIDHALAVLDYADEIQAAEGGAPLVVKAAAILHDIGILAAESKHGSSGGKYQEMEGPAIAREILRKQGAAEESIERICGIIANHHSSRDVNITETDEFKIVWDADWLLNFPEHFGNKTNEIKRQRIGEIFRTNKGREIAGRLFVK